MVDRRHLKFLLGALAFQPCMALAIPSMMPSIGDRELRIGVLGNVYLSNANQPGSDEGSGNSGLRLDYRGLGNKNDFHYGVESAFLGGLTKKLTRYLDVGELYGGLENKNLESRFFTYVGRKRFEWSDLDSYWALGLFQPRLRWDYLSEKENGLAGIFLGYSSDYVSIHAYWSPIFIPEQGAPMEVSRGTCRTSSPWFTCPSSSVTVFGQPTPVHFTLAAPSVSEIISHSGAGVSIRVGKYKGPFARFSYAHKPMNQLLLAFEGRLDLSTNSIPAIIHPRVVYHDIYSLDAGVQDTRHSATFSAIWERPRRDYTPAHWNTQEASNSILLGGTLRTKPFRRWQSTRAEASYHHRHGGIAPDQGPFASTVANFFEPRYSFLNAFSFAFFTPFTEDWAPKFLGSIKFVWDTPNAGNILIVESHFYPWTNWIVNFGLDILGSAATTPVDFIARYQRNDRIRGGVTYVF